MNTKLLTAALATFALSAYAQDKMPSKEAEAPVATKAAAAAHMTGAESKEGDLNNVPQHLQDSVQLLSLYEKQLTQELHEDVAKKATDYQIISVARNIVKIQDAISMLKALENIHIQNK